MKRLYFLFFIAMSLVFVTAKGQSQTKSSIDQRIDLSILIEKKNPSNENPKDGLITVKVIGGVAPYTISVFSTEIPYRKYSSDEVKLYNLNTGSYLFIIQDANKEIIQKTIELASDK